MGLKAIGINPDDLRLIIPVLVALDVSLESQFVGWHLNQELQKRVEGLENPRGITVMPLIVLSAEELEDIEANREPLGIFEMLKKKAIQDPEQNDSFHIFARKELWTQVKRNQRIKAQFDVMFARMVKLLFGDQPSH